jgi:prepilin-type N-terminal cleavage/methylation domain-containing protein
VSLIAIRRLCQRSLANTRHDPRGQRGFSLIELMVAVVVSGIVLLGVFAFGSITQTNAARHRGMMRVQQSLEGAMHSMGLEVRSAGLGFARACTELRVWDENSGKLINPGAVDGANISDAVVDGITDEPYWVLRDGIQAHWRSDAAFGVSSINGTETFSSSPTSGADSFDVISGDPSITTALNLFTLVARPSVSASDATLTVESASSGTPLDSSNAAHLSWVRQLFPPGGFVVVAAAHDALTFAPAFQQQCALVQITGEVAAGSSNNQWEIPISDASDFNADLSQLFEGGPTDADPTLAGGDWDPAVADGTLAADASGVIALGNLTWSRYEIDYTFSERPYLVRADIIASKAGDTHPADTPITDDYPQCVASDCDMPALHLPGSGDEPPRTAVAPMIEDMQVSVGCDGHASGTVVGPLSIGPETGFDEKGPETGEPRALTPNTRVDEWTNDKGQDEWVGNHAGETWAPDCVYYGTGERNSTQWAASSFDSESGVAPGFRLSPSTIRITLLAKPQEQQNTDADFGDDLFGIEDRPKMDSQAPGREYVTLTERFTPRNLRWRDPALDL